MALISRALLIALICALASGAALAQTLSASKLSAHLINAYTAGSSNVVSGHPRVLKVLGLDSGFPFGMVQAMRDYKARVPGGKIVLRVYSPKTYTLSNDATVSAGDFWTNIIQRCLTNISVSDRALIDYLEGPNEGQTPTLGYPTSAPIQASQWFNQFWTNLTPRIAAASYKPCIGSISVGNPGGTTPQMQSYLAAFVPALRQAQAAGGGWSYHAYTVSYSTDPSVEIYWSLRYRQFYSYFASAFADIASIPLILTEGGVDLSGDPSTSGWQARGSQADYERWLNWFDSQLQQDSYVVGCMLFENGDPTGWSSFDLEPICAWFKNYLLGPAAYPPPPNPAATAGNGVVTITWTNAPVTPTTWNVKRSTNSTGPFFIVGANVNGGVTASTFVDTGVSNSTTYYYVVTALNALGESAPSSTMSATPVAATSIAINCGGGAVGSFQADNFFDSGTAFSTSTSVATNGLVQPAPTSVYQAQRYGDLTYTLQALVPNSSYKVRLHFAEVYWTFPDQRVFNVFINGGPALNDFDINATAGGSYKGVIEEFFATSDLQGRITIQLATVIDNAAINGIEVQRVNPTSLPSPPSNLTANVGDAVVNVSWTPSSPSTGYYVKRATTSGGPYSTIAANVTSSTFSDVGFVPNTTYYYVVTATNSFGESVSSSETSATPDSGLPDVAITSVTWTPSTLFPGSHGVFTAHVVNRGSAPTPADVVLGVGFNMDGAGTVSWSGSYTTPLDPGDSIDLTADNGPSGVNYWAATAGQHTLVATVDDVNRFQESDEGNNFFTIPVPVLATNYAINAGGLAVGSFKADSNWAGSANTYSVTNTITTTGVPNAAPAAVYQSERWGAFSYVLNNLVPGSNYIVRLHFAEISASVNNPGDRQFNIFANGTLAFSQFDVMAQAGGKFKALTRDIKKKADANGLITLDFTPGASNQPKLSGLELIPNTTSFPPPSISRVTLTSGIAAIQWLSSTGSIYQVQYTDSLLPPLWKTAGTNFTATTSTSIMTNAVQTTTRRFYRVVRFD